MTYIFHPPTRESGITELATNRDPVISRLFGHFTTHIEGLTVLKTGSSYETVVTPTEEQQDSADIIYQGGHRYIVSEEEKDLLVAAGYTVETE